MNDSKSIIKDLKKYHNPKNIEGMKRFGIGGKNVLGGPSIPVSRSMAKKIGKDHVIARELWDSEIHEARILAGFIDDPKLVTEKQMNLWVNDFDSWDICDLVCSSLFDKTAYAKKMLLLWVKDDKEFVKRAGFVMMAALAVHDNVMKDEDFEKYFPIIKKYSVDERNFVKKAVNWALRQIGKRNKRLNIKAINTAKDILKINSKSARWIANNAIIELTSTSVKNRLR